jgi:hypothetical protein
MRRLVLTLAAVASLPCATAAQAAPTIQTDRSCYSRPTPLRLTGSGFTPGGPLEITAAYTYPDGQTETAGSFPATADASGALATSFGLAEIETAQLRITVTVNDRTRIAQGAPPAEQTASTTFTQVFFGAYYRPWNTDGPATAQPGRSATLEASGYLDSNSRVLYVHYIRNGRLAKTLRVGRLSGPCAMLTTRFRQFDFRPLKAGTYRVEFDTTKSWPNDDLLSGYRRVVVRARDAKS